jgi:hypothetical protein
MMCYDQPSTHLAMAPEAIPQSKNCGSPVTNAAPRPLAVLIDSLRLNPVATPDAYPPTSSAASWPPNSPHSSPAEAPDN